VPFELDWDAANEMATDTDFVRLNRSALNDKYLTDKLYGNNPAGILSLVLLGLGRWPPG